MWSHLTLLLIVGAAVVGGESNHAWTKNKEYEYVVRTQTITSMEKSDKYLSGIVTKAVFVVQVKSPDLLLAKIIKPQYARVHTQMPHDWHPTTNIPDNQLEFQEIPMSGKPFEIQLKHGIIQDIFVDKIVPTWELNILKSIVSQVQIDVQGENAIVTKHDQIPTDENPFAAFTAVEDSVGGKCEVFYNIMPLSFFHTASQTVFDKPKMVPKMIPFSNHGSNDNYFQIIKTKNYNKCTQQSEYHFGTDGKTHSKWGTDPTASIIEKSSTSHVIIFGTLKQFTIYSSETINNILINPELNTDYYGSVSSKINLDLVSKKDISESEIPSSSGYESTGNLVYLHGNPYWDKPKRQFKPGHVSISKNFMPVQSSENSGSFIEEKNDHDNREEINEHEQDFIQTKPKIDEVPEIMSFMPRFIGIHGQNIQKSDKIDVVKEAARLCKEIAKELEKFDDVVSEGTLEKFSIMVGLISIMNVQQINDLQKNAEKVNVGETHKACEEVYRSAVTQAGTGPALRIIKQWIKEGEVQNWEAAQIISMIPKVARVPTPEYVKEFFEIIKEPIVQKQMFVNSTAPYAFAELILNAQVNENKKKNRYPVHVFGPMIPEDDETLVKTYMPFMAQQMKEAIQDNDSPRAQAYIMAIGKFGHPHILSVFEPYLEGTHPVSKHQRVMMVVSLIELAENFPKLAMSVLFKIYANPEEAYEVRVAAIYLFMKTNPPLVMMQRMAQYTNYDMDEQVNSVVKSVIEGFAKMNVPEWQEISEKARIARKLLTHKEYSYKHSQSYLKNAALFGLRKIYSIILETIRDESGDYPKGLYFVDPAKDFIGQPKTEIAFIVSSIKQFMKSMQQQEDDGKSHEIDQIIHAINMQPQVSEQMEGMMLYNDMYGSFLYTFDNFAIEKIFKFFSEVKPTKQLSLNRLRNYVMTVSFPTETGFPFTYEVERPTYCKVYVRRNLEKHSHSLTKSSGVVNWAHASKKMARFGFVTAFEHQSYVAGVDTDFQWTIPVAFEYERNTPEKTIHFKVRPSKSSSVKQIKSESQSEFKVFHYGVVPFTAKVDVTKFQPVSFDRNIVRTNELHTKEYNFDMVRLKTQYDGKYSKDFITFIKQIFSFTGEDNSYKTFDVYVNNDKTKDWTSIKFAYGNKEFDIKSKDSQPSTKEISTIFKDQISSQERRDVVMEEVGKGFVSPTTAGAVDFIIDIPTVPQQKYVVTFGVAKNNAYESTNYQTIFHFQSFKDKKANYEICSYASVYSSQDIALDYEKAVKRVPKDDYYVEVKFGTTCASGNGFNINGTGTQTKEFKEAIIHSKIVKKCKSEIQQGNKALGACQKANKLTKIKNHFSVSMEISDEMIIEGTNSIADYIQGQSVHNHNNNHNVHNHNNNFIQKYEMFKKFIVSEEDKESGTEKIGIEVTVSPDVKEAEVAMHTVGMDFKFPSIDLSEVQIFKEAANRIWKPENDDVTCTIDKNKVITFDNKVYPIKLGKCQHVMLITRSYWNWNPDVPKVAVIVEEEDEDSKKVQVIFGSHSRIDLQKIYTHNIHNKHNKHNTHDTDYINDPDYIHDPHNTHDTHYIHDTHNTHDYEIKINNDKIMIPKQGSYIYTVGNDIIAEIYKLPDSSVRVDSPKYLIAVVYDGERVQVEVSDSYHNAVLGLCGNNDWQPSNDFMTSKECVMDKPEEFTATYALTKRNCQGPAMKNKRIAEQAVCVKKINRQSNVISDREAGRPMIENKQWGHHWQENQDQEKTSNCTIYRTKIVEDNDTVCFTVRPLPQCAANCKPVATKTKRVALHCLPNNKASIAMKHRIEKGANPDMSNRSISKLHVFTLPVACIAT